MSDFIILKALEERSRYRLLSPLVPLPTLVPDARAMLQWFGAYFASYPDAERIDHQLLLAYAKTKAEMPAETWAIFCNTVNRLRDYNNPEAVQGIVNNLLERDLAGKVGALVDSYETGADVDLLAQLKDYVVSTSKQVENSSAGTYIDESIDSILADEGCDRGLKLPTNLLRDHISGLLGGATICVAARVDKGKTSLLASIATHIAPQLPEYFGEDRPILWLNNEGAGRRIYPRLYTAALGKNSHQLLEMSKAGTLLPAYIKAVGKFDRIRIKDIHGASMAQVEQVIEAMNPSVVIIDMMANIRSGAVQGGNKTDALEAVWQTFREMAVMHDFVGIGTCQVSNEGDNELYPMYGALKDSKTGIQGAVDIILMLGALNSPNMATVRGLSTPKNKFSLPGMPSHAQGQVHFDAEFCKFIDAPT